MESEEDVCSFCRIGDNDTDTEILLSDEQLLCFRDVKPGATHHYLIVPRMHIDNCKALQGTDVPLVCMNGPYLMCLLIVEQMEKMGRSILEKNKVSDLDDVSQYDELQVTAALRATVSLVHHSR
ncbi:histidine triad nucleotide-binding protein 3-like isoform X3 [Hippoglossus hippoglossus]|uniref:histidine triad nucleotide-binding protein 3-like isoform X3 n=1 Tax=Hippoglossus hippoglossus TaxID=8267 RepID=UPI00148E80EB|nr:histidine triad nucleotide-binding protein 3-like isoform X3 [Hippoglossus hippoglossus]